MVNRRRYSVLGKRVETRDAVQKSIGYRALDPMVKPRDAEKDYRGFIGKVQSAVNNYLAIDSAR